MKEVSRKKVITVQVEVEIFEREDGKFTFYFDSQDIAERIKFYFMRKGITQKHPAETEQ